MKFTLNECLARVNQVLNYPAVAYEDVSHFFDQAMAELNTNLRIALPSVTEMRSEHTFDITNHKGLVRLVKLPDYTDTIPWFGSVLNIPDTFHHTYKYVYVCPLENYSSRTFYKWDGNSWEPMSNLYGIYVDANSVRTYTAVAIDTSEALWVPVDSSHTEEFDLCEYLPLDWWTLFVIPYVCFKFSVRNGDSGELFADEFTQGFQQLQASYHVPNTVKLFTVAGKLAYRDLVEQHLANLNISVATRAIYENMRIGNGVSLLRDGYFVEGGWL